MAACRPLRGRRAFPCDVTGLAIWRLVVGAVLLFGGTAALDGKSWGYFVGILAASVAALSEFFSIFYTPVWSTIIIVVSVVVLVAFIRVPARN